MDDDPSGPTGVGPVQGGDGIGTSFDKDEVCLLEHGMPGQVCQEHNILVGTGFIGPDLLGQVLSFLGIAHQEDVAGTGIGCFPVHFLVSPFNEAGCHMSDKGGPQSDAHEHGQSDGNDFSKS